MVDAKSLNLHPSMMYMIQTDKTIKKLMLILVSSIRAAQNMIGLTEMTHIRTNNRTYFIFYEIMLLTYVIMSFTLSRFLIEL